MHILYPEFKLGEATEIGRGIVTAADAAAVLELLGIEATGTDGREVELQNNGTHIQWRYVGDASWTNLVALADITGPHGAEGAPGPNEVTTSTVTDIDGLLKGDGSAVSGATAGVDYLIPSDIASGTITPKSGDLDFNSLGGGGGNSFSTIQPQIGGTNGTAVEADSSSDTLTINANCGAVLTGNNDTLTLDCVGVPYVAWQAGSADYYLTAPSGTYSQVALTANRKYLCPIIIQRRITITSARIAVTTGPSGMTRLGLRNVNIQDGQPTTLVVDFGEVDTSTTGVKAITGLSQVVNPGFYYLEILSSGTPTLRSCTPELLGQNMLSGGFFSVGNLNGIYRAYTYASLPADETAQAHTELQGQVPIILFRYT